MAIISRIEKEPFHDNDKLNSLENYINKGLSICDKKEIKPICICISTKGNPNEYMNNFMKRQYEDVFLPPAKRNPEIKETDFKFRKKTMGEILTSRLSDYRKDLPPLFILNRFQAFAYGAFFLHGSQLSDSYSCVNLSNGVGCGNIIHGELQQSYTKSGTGGLRKIICPDTQKQKTIASIAGVNAIITRMKAYNYDSIENCVSRELESKSPFMKEIIDAISELIVREVPDSIMHVGINVYNNKIPLNIRKLFVSNVFKDIKSKTPKFKYISVFDTFYDEDTVKMLGAVNFALNKLRKTRITSPILTYDNIFVIEGLPGSGKSTLAKMLYDELRTKLDRIAYIVCKDIRSKGKRSGFEIMISGYNRTLELAIVNDRKEYDKNIYKKFGRYLVNYYNVHEYVVPAIWSLLDDNDTLIIDAVAGMQLFCPDFRDTIMAIYHGRKNIVFTVPKVSDRYALIQDLKFLAESRKNLYTLEVLDRAKSQTEILKSLMKSLTK